MNLNAAYWYRYISFDPLKVGKARIVKNTVFGMGVEDDSARFFVWFPNTNEQVYAEYEDIQKLDAASRPYNGAIQGTPVLSGITAKRLLEVQNRKRTSVLDFPSETPPPIQTPIKEKSPEIPDSRPVEVLTEMVRDYPFVYGLPLRPYDSHFVIDEPHIYMSQGEWYALGNDHPDSKCRHGVVCYAKRIGADDAASFDMVPLSLNTISASAWETEVEEWAIVMANAAELEIYEKTDAITSRSIRDYTSGWMRSKMFEIKYNLSRKHPEWVASSQVSRHKWEHMQAVFNDVRAKDIERILMMLADPIADQELVKEVEDMIFEHIVNEDVAMNLESLNEWVDIISYPSRRLRYCKKHRFYDYGGETAAELDEAIANYDRLEDACWEASEHRIKRRLEDYLQEKEQKKLGKVEGVHSLPNNPQVTTWETPFPAHIEMTTTPIETGSGAVVPCTDQKIIDLMNQILPLLGNRVPMKADYITWGIGPATAMITYLRSAKQILSINPQQIERIYGRCDLATLGSAITHEMGHYVLNQVVKNSDVMKFKRQAAAINLHKSQSTAGGSPYPFYHEQFAMLCEYGVWGSCARGLQSTRGWDIVNKYFNITQHITPEVIRKYQN